jgi:tetratricopeptide (TPR) repeat protein
MAADPTNFAVFRLSSNPSIKEIAESFKYFPELAAPVVQAQADRLTLYTIPAYTDKELSLLPVFTSPGLIDPPYTAKPAPLFLQLLFNAPSANASAFNPKHAKSGFSLAEVRLDKRQISAVIGFLQTPSPLPAGAELESALKNEAGLGNLHRANYMASILLTGRSSAPPSGLYAELLINLGLLQEAYDYIKSAQTPDFYYYRALILRLSGDSAKARQWLGKIPAGTSFEDKNRLELAWLALEDGNADEALRTFRPMAKNSFDKAGALFGVGSALIKKSASEKTPAAMDEILAAFSSALNHPSPLIPDILLQLGNLYFKAGNYTEAETCYGKAAAARPTIQSKTNLTLAIIKTGKLREAAALINDIALVDVSAAGRLAKGLPPGSAAGLLEDARQHTNVVPVNLPTTVQNPASNPPPAAANGAPEPQRRFPPVYGAQMVPSYMGPEENRPPAGGITVSLEPATPKKVISVRTERKAEYDTFQPPASDKSTPQTLQPGELQMESLMDAVTSSPMPTETETRQDDFMGRAFKLAASLEEESGKKIFFNAEGLTEVERKLRLTFIKARQNPQEALETVKNCSAFLCFLLQERHRGRLIKMPDFDHWGWPVVFDAPNNLATYPIQRVWKLLWEGNLPEPGWLTRYFQYVESELMSGKTERPQGAAAVQGRIQSHPERMIDAQTEHRRIMLLVSTLEETSAIELGRSGIVKLEKALKDKFRPDIPPTADGWKLLRCYGHMLAEILINDFKANWYNVDGNDGFWSMQLPGQMFVFPIGKIYKTASNRENLGLYYDALLAEKLRILSGGAKI